MEELGADAIVEPDAPGDVLHVRPHMLAEIRDLVDERDLGRQERIGRVLGQLGGPPGHGQDRRLVEIERAVNLVHDALCPRFVRADDDAVGALEVGDRRAFAQEFRVGHDRELRIRTGFADDALHLVAGAHGHGRFRDHHRIAVHGPRDVAGGLVHIGKVRVAVPTAGGGSDRDEHGFGGPDRFGQGGGEGQASFARVLGDELGQARLEDGDLAAVEGLDLARVLVDAAHLVAEIREAGPGHQTDITRPDHRNAHQDLSFVMRARV